MEKAEDAIEDQVGMYQWVTDSDGKQRPYLIRRLNGLDSTSGWFQPVDYTEMCLMQLNLSQAVNTTIKLPTPTLTTCNVPEILPQYDRTRLGWRHSKLCDYTGIHAPMSEPCYLRQIKWLAFITLRCC